MTTDIRRDWPDLEYSAVIHKLEQNDEGTIYRVTFALYEHLGVDDMGAILLHKNGCDDRMEYVENAGDAEVAVYGEIKFDGSSTWWIDDSEGPFFLQTSGRESLEDFGKMMARCHDWAGEIIGGWAWADDA